MQRRCKLRRLTPAALQASLTELIRFEPIDYFAVDGVRWMAHGMDGELVVVATSGERRRKRPVRARPVCWQINLR